MDHKTLSSTHIFFATPPLPCPYLPGRVERRAVPELAGSHARPLLDRLSRAGFRRSHRIAYVPACPNCTECRAARIVADGFTLSRSQRRVWKLNADIVAQEPPLAATEEQYGLFSAYVTSRHGDSDMARMDFLDYRSLVEDSPVDTVLVEFRDAARRLVASCLMDRLDDGLSAVYSFFDPELRRRSLGIYIVLWLAEQAKTRGLPHAYLGYWIAGCTKMSYKAAFCPLEVYSPQGWHRLGADSEKTRQVSEIKA